MAAQDAELDMSVEDPNRVGTIIGTGIGGIKTMEDTVERIEKRGPGKNESIRSPDDDRKHGLRYGLHHLRSAGTGPD